MLLHPPVELAPFFSRLFEGEMPRTSLLDHQPEKTLGRPRSQLQVECFPVLYDFEQEQGREFATRQTEHEVLLINLDDRGPYELSGLVRFFEPNQIVLVEHMRLTSFILRSDRTCKLCGQVPKSFGFAAAG